MVDDNDADARDAPMDIEPGISIVNAGDDDCDFDVDVKNNNDHDDEERDKEDESGDKKEKPGYLSWESRGTSYQVSAR